MVYVQRPSAIFFGAKSRTSTQLFGWNAIGKFKNYLLWRSNDGLCLLEKLLEKLDEDDLELVVTLARRI